MNLENINLKKGEIFKPVKGYENLYLISNYGTLYSISRRKVMKTSKIHSGYISARLQKNNIKFRTGVHRLVAIAFLPTDDYNMEVNHKDGNKENNHVDNLEWVTTKQNIRHSILNGLKETKYTPEEIEELCKFLCSDECKKYNYEELSMKFKIDPSTIESIYNRRTWKIIVDKYPEFKKIKFKTNKKTDEEIEEICKYIKKHDDESYQSIANRFGVNRTYISDLKKKKYRKNITEKYF